MSLFALLAWITTAGFGLYLLSIWLIEYDKDFQSVAATRLPPSVLTAHVLLAGGGLLTWIAYLIYDQDRLAWAAVVAILMAATLGVTMAIRWLSVYRAGRDAKRSQAEQAEARLALVAGPGPYGSGPDGSGPDGSGPVATLERVQDFGPPERNFPLPVVIAHGAFAAVTITLVLLTALGVGGS